MIGTLWFGAQYWYWIHLSGFTDCLFCSTADELFVLRFTSQRFARALPFLICRSPAARTWGEYCIWPAKVQCLAAPRSALGQPILRPHLLSRSTVPDKQIAVDPHTSWCNSTARNTKSSVLKEGFPLTLICGLLKGPSSTTRSLSSARLFELLLEKFAFLGWLGNYSECRCK